MSSTDLLNNPTTQIKYVQAPGQPYVIKRDQAEKLDGRAESAYYTPQSSLSGVFVQPTQVTFEIMPSTQTHIIDAMNLELVVRNTNVGTALLMPSFFFLQRMEIYSGSNLIDTIYPEQNFYESVLDNSRDYINAHLGVWNISANYGVTASTLAAGASQTYFIPVKSVLTQSKVFIRALRTKLEVRCFFGSFSEVTQSTTVATNGLVLDSCILRVDGFRFRPEMLASLIKSYEDTPHVARGVVRRYERLTASGATSGVDSTMTLTSLNGTYSHLRFFLRTNGAAREALIAGIRLNTFTILDSNGAPLSYQNISGEYNRLEMAASKIASDFYSKTGTQTLLYQYTFAEQPVDTFQDGHNGGEQVLNSNYRLVANPSATGAAEMYVMAYNLVNIAVEDGALAVRIL